MVDTRSTSVFERSWNEYHSEAVTRRTMTEIQRLVDELAHRLQRSVAVDNPRGRLIASSRHFGDEDTPRVDVVLSRGLDRRVAKHLNSFDIQSATSKVITSANDELGLKARCCYPLRRNGRLLGYIWLIDSVGPDEIVAPYAEQFAKLLDSELDAKDFQVRQLSELGRQLLTPKTDLHETIVELRRHGFSDEKSQIRVIVVAQPLGHQRRDQFPSIRESSSAREWMRNGQNMIQVPLNSAVALICSTAPGQHDDSAEVFGKHLGAELHEENVRIGLSDLGVLPSTRTLFRQAILAASAAHIFDELDTVVSWAAAYPHRFLLEMVLSRSQAAKPPQQLDALFDPSNSALLDTMETYLDHGGDRTATAQALFIHRSTLYYRLSQVQKLTGFDPSDGRNRLAFHLAIKLHRVEASGIAAVLQNEENLL